MSKSQEKGEKEDQSLGFKTLEILDIEMGTNLKGLVTDACSRVSKARKNVEEIALEREALHISIPTEKDEEEKLEEDKLLSDRMSALEDSFASYTEKMNGKFNSLVLIHKDLEEKVAGLSLRIEEVYAEVIVTASYIAMFRMQLQRKSEEMQKEQAKKPANANANK